MVNDAVISIGAKIGMLASLKPDAPAVSCGELTRTHAELHRRTNRIARGLLEHGVKHGDLVTVGLPNGIDFVEACYALWKIGATPQPVSSRLPEVELEAIMELARTPLVLGAFGERSSRPCVNIAELSARSQDPSDLPDVTAPCMKAPTSGGSTGTPKLILSGLPGVSARTIPEVGGWRMRPESVALMPAPLYHNAGFSMMLAALGVGAHLVLLPKFEPEGVLAQVQHWRASWLYVVPTMMNRIWHLPSEVKASYDLSSLQTMWHLAAPCPAWLKAAFIEWLGPDVVMELYGGTESVASTTITGREWLEHRGSVGKPTIGEMKAFDDQHQPLPAGELGEIYMRRTDGAPAAYRYVGATSKVLDGGWESLGDIGWLDADGYVYLADRRTDMILVGGSNVYPAEVEAALEQHPLVESAAVIGIPDDDLGNRVHAVIKRRAPIDSDELERHMAARLVRYKQPRSYEFVQENLRDDAGKVRRGALREERIQRAAQERALAPSPPRGTLDADAGAE
jgi:bile acid-coenzyme A ligase